MANSKKVSFDLYKSGVVADLSFSIWGAATKLKEDDLGLKRIPVDKISLGQKRLIKRDKLRKVLSASYVAREFLRLNSFQFPFGTARFIPHARLNRVIEKMNECEELFFKNVEELLEEYETIRTEMLKEYDVAFEDILKQHNEIPSSERSEKKRMLLSRLEEKYPSREELRERFRFEFVIFEITSPEFKQLSNVEALDKVEKVAEMERIYQEKVARKLDLFLADVMSHLKAMVLEIVDKLSKKLEKDSVKMSTVKSFMKFAEAFRAMDFVDMNIDSAIRSLEDKLKDVSKSDLDDAKFKAVLDKEVAKIKEAADSVEYSKVLGKYKRYIRVVDEGEKDELGTNQERKER